MIKLVSMLGLATFTFTNVTGPPINNTHYNNGLIDYYITYQMNGNDDTQNATFCYTSPVAINNYLSNNTIDGLNDYVYLSYGDNFYTMINDSYDVGSGQETELYMVATRQNFYLDVNEEVSSFIEISLDGEPVSFHYSLSASYRLTNVGYNDNEQLIYPKYINKSMILGGTASNGYVNFFQVFFDSIYDHTSTGDYLDLIYIDNFRISIDFYNDNINGPLSIVLDNDYSTINYQENRFNAYNQYIDTFLNDVVVPDFQLSTYLINSVGGFMDFEIAPNISLGSILGIVLAFGLVFFIIKYFAGG